MSDRRGERRTGAARTRRAMSRILRVSLALILPTASGAQGASFVTGRIIDTTGAPIVAANVRVPQLERVQVVDSAGRYRLEGLPTGRMTLVGEAPGFAGKRVDVIIGASGMVEQDFSLVPNAHVLANVAVRARARRQLPIQLHEFEQRRTRAAGRFLGPDDLAKFGGRPLSDALKTVMRGRTKEIAAA